MSQTSHGPEASGADTPNEHSENPGAPGQRETGSARRETREAAQHGEQAHQGMPASGLLGPAGCLGVLSGTAPLTELLDQPED